ncbi:uncharacterized protein PGTG_21548 [Puccinia graminis f. sp. tritici CRL 75-36-700-3]|uniref:CCHC-type domain-containing protein n=1 Tax=Puccinia graminis f. sp. tritici (strain CRL 75-36-700-3 / race SCCL) TaxID=418459 RepID=H6QRS6_PUCGT|nr:uncharacterized protein PGTG_21548 [Puccinia graminis f. sp. tritici CRL 75-36-700-3]EHS63373.1 hypothetical protein PGTG_21548 [Puccinia graminis f. sp. tritici CRL 75-36-700-3]
MSTEVIRETKVLLTPHNYALWLLPMEARLFKLNLLDIVENKVETKTEDDKVAWNKLNNTAYSEIIAYIGQEVLGFVSSALPSTPRFNGQGLWKLLKAQYAGDDLTSQTTALDQFLHLDFSSITSFIPSVRSANQKITMSGLILDDRVRTILMLKKLPSDYRSFRDIVSMNYGTESFESVIKKLESYVAQNDLDKKPPSTSSIPIQSLLTRPNDQASSNSNSAVCSHCKKPGHRPHNCWVKFPEKAPRTEAAHATLQENYNQLNDPTDFTHFRLADGVLHHVDEIKFDGVKYF